MSRTLLRVMLVFSLLLTAVGVAMIVSGETDGWMFGLFSLTCAAIAATQLKPALLLSEKRDVGALAASYPGPLTLQASRRRLIFFALAMLGFVVPIGSMLLEDAVGPLAIAMWPGFVLFAVGVPLLIAATVKGMTLQLDGKGMTISHFWRRWQQPWTEIEGFEAVSVAPASTRMVAYDYRLADATRVGRMNHSLVGRNSALSDTYGFAAEDLASLLNRWRGLALSDETGRGAPSASS